MTVWFYRLAFFEAHKSWHLLSVRHLLVDFSNQGDSAPIWQHVGTFLVTVWGEHVTSTRCEEARRCWETSYNALDKSLQYGIIQSKRSAVQKLRNSSIKRQQRCRKCCNIPFARKIWKTSWHLHAWHTLSLFRNQLTFNFPGNHTLHLSPPGWISYSFIQLFHR